MLIETEFNYRVLCGELVFKSVINKENTNNIIEGQNSFNEGIS